MPSAQSCKRLAEHHVTAAWRRQPLKIPHVAWLTAIGSSAATPKKWRILRDKLVYGSAPQVESIGQMLRSGPNFEGTQVAARVRFNISDRTFPGPSSTLLWRT